MTKRPDHTTPTNTSPWAGRYHESSQVQRCKTEEENEQKEGRKHNKRKMVTSKIGRKNRRINGCTRTPSVQPEKKRANQQLHPNPKCPTGKTSESTVAPKPQVSNRKNERINSCTRTPSVQLEKQRTQLHLNPKR